MAEIIWAEIIRVGIIWLEIIWNVTEPLESTLNKCVKIYQDFSMVFLDVGSFFLVYNL